jgi:transposase
MIQPFYVLFIIIVITVMESGDNHRWFLHDNDLKRTSGLIKHWLFNNGIQLIDVPPYSPDINPIENLWSDMNRRVESRFAHTIDELK